MNNKKIKGGIKLFIDDKELENDMYWVDDNLNVINPQKGIDVEKQLYEMKYLALIEKGIMITEHEKDKMWMFFKMNNEPDKSINVVKKYNQLIDIRNEKRKRIINNIKNKKR